MAPAYKLSYFALRGCVDMRAGAASLGRASRGMMRRLLRARCAARYTLTRRLAHVAAWRRSAATASPSAASPMRTTGAWSCAVAERAPRHAPSRAPSLRNPALSRLMHARHVMSRVPRALCGCNRASSASRSQPLRKRSVC
jgi:hypothetical protein